MLTRLVGQCCKHEAGKRPKPSHLPLSNLHFPLSSAFLALLFPDETNETKKKKDDTYNQPDIGRLVNKAK